MEIRKLWVAALVGWLAMTASYAETQVSGRSVRDTFADERVASLVIAVSNGDYGEADKALKSGADVNAVGVEGLTPLLWVMGTTLNVGKIEYLLKAGANPNYRDAKSMVSPMYLAAGGNRLDVLELLLKQKGNPNLPGPKTETMLMVAVAQFRDKNVDLLLKYGADINQTDKHRETVANVATSYGRYDLIAHFLEIGLTHDLQDLAKDVEMTKVPAGSEAQRWKDKVIEMLKARGAKFPAFIPRKVE